MSKKKSVSTIGVVTSIVCSNLLKILKEIPDYNKYFRNFGGFSYEIKNLIPENFFLLHVFPEKWQKGNYILIEMERKIQENMNKVESYNVEVIEIVMDNKFHMRLEPEKGNFVNEVKKVVHFTYNLDLYMKVETVLKKLCWYD
ncbi:MAG: hypothetical protein LiPW41_466 [Parcubacteria group bacterium LiPW_41]|nr:MAG: hypothetical protein LiPW41_466 [Parcubacteria group bacterium LiPW_41]